MDEWCPAELNDICTEGDAAEDIPGFGSDKVFGVWDFDPGP